MDELKQHFKATFSPYEIQLLHYMYLCFFYEWSKFILMLVFFTLFHMQKDFIVEVIILLSIRNFFGGLHFKKYCSCFLFTFIFISSGLLLSRFYIIGSSFQIFILVVALLTSYFIKPIVSSNRTALSQKQQQIYHTCGMAILLLYLLLFITLKTFPYSNICFWIIVLQTLQLIVAKILTKGGEKSK